MVKKLKTYLEVRQIQMNNKYKRIYTKTMASPNDILEEAIVEIKERKNWIGFLIQMAIVVVVFIIIFTVIIGTAKVGDESMKPSINQGDRVVYLRLGSDYKANDIIVYKTKENQRLIKRVVAVEGDQIDVLGDNSSNPKGSVAESISQVTKAQIKGKVFFSFGKPR